MPAKPGAQEGETAAAALCRRALEDGTAIEVVREVMDETGKKKQEQIQRTVGLGGAVAGSRTSSWTSAYRSRTVASELSYEGMTPNSGDADASASNSNSNPNSPELQEEMLPSQEGIEDEAGPRKRGRPSKKPHHPPTTAPFAINRKSSRIALNREDSGGVADDFEMEMDERDGSTWNWNKSQNTSSTFNSHSRGASSSSQSISAPQTYSGLSGHHFEGPGAAGSPSFVSNVHQRASSNGSIATWSRNNSLSSGSPNSEAISNMQPQPNLSHSRRASNNDLPPDFTPLSSRRPSLLNSINPPGSGRPLPISLSAHPYSSDRSTTSSNRPSQLAESNSSNTLPAIRQL